jgi:hypothetical protein
MSAALDVVVWNVGQRELGASHLKSQICKVYRVRK